MFDLHAIGVRAHADGVGVILHAAGNEALSNQPERASVRFESQLTFRDVALARSG